MIRTLISSSLITAIDLGKQSQKNLPERPLPLPDKSRIIGTLPMSPNKAVNANVTAMLREWNSDRPEAAEELLPLIYEELHRRAVAYMRRERQNHTLQPTALVHE